MRPTPEPYVGAFQFDIAVAGAAVLGCTSFMRREQAIDKQPVLVGVGHMPLLADGVQFGVAHEHPTPVADPGAPTHVETVGRTTVTPNHLLRTGNQRFAQALPLEACSPRAVLRFPLDGLVAAAVAVVGDVAVAIGFNIEARLVGAGSR